jgi:hypothetical protein
LLWGSKLGWFPWETPAGNGLLGGRPQLTAGIRAGSYIFSVPTSANQRQLSASQGEKQLSAFSSQLSAF